MAELFLKVVNLSFSASWLALAVIAARFLLKKAPKWVNVLLWGLVAVRLIFPFSIESAMSLIPSAEVVSPEIMMDTAPEIQTGFEAVNSAVNPVITETFAPDPAASVNPLQIWIPIFAAVWCMGMAFMLLYTLVSYLRLQHQVRLAIRVSGNVYLSENIASPFVLGIFKPKIYLPYGMKELDMYHVIAHERTHIRRRDHWWKPLGFGLLTVHWFNPVLWIAYILLCRDIELACDEKVIKELGMEQRADYSQALLNCSVNHRMIAACPIAFGEVGVKERVKNVLSYKKPAFWVIVIALVLCIIVAACFLTDPAPELIDRIVNQDGYRILFQTDMDIALSVSKQRLPEECYSVEGYTFPDKRADVHHFGSSIYLKHVGYTDESGDYIRLTYGMEYEPEENVVLVLVPYSVITENGVTAYAQSSIFVSGGKVTADTAQFEDACTAECDVAKQEFSVTIRRDAWDAAREGIHFTVDGFRRITFAKEPLFGEVNPRPITHSLIVEDIDFAQATFWGDSTSHLELTTEQIGELVHILYQLPQDDFEPSTFPINTISLMVSCGGREMLLSTNGSYVYFTFDSETAANLDGDWMTADEDLIKFLTGLAAYADAETFYGVSLMIEEVTPNGATVVFTGAGEKPEGRLMGGNDYWVQVEMNGVWEDIAKVPEPSFTTEAYDVDNIRRHKIDWQWRYGTLPSGHYRIGKDVTYQEGAKPTQTATVWAEFTLSDPAYDAFSILSNLIPDNARAEADFVTGGGYNCFRQEAQELVGILNSIEESELMVSPAMTPTTSITVYANETVTLHYNGMYVQFAFNTGESQTTWTVNNAALNAFIERINKNSPSESTYEIYNVAPLEDLPESYSLEEATIDKVVIMVDGDISANQEVWAEFIDKTSAGTPATVRLMYYYFPQESVPGFKVIYDLTYDGSSYLWESVQDGIYYAEEFPYLRYFTGEPDDADEFGPYDWDVFEYYVLTDSETATWGELQHNGTYNPKVFMNLIYTPKQPEIPYAVSAELRLNGLPLITVTDEQQVHEIWYLMEQSIYLGYEPKTYNLGVDLVLTGEDGSTATVQLDLDGDLMKFGDLFYDYGPGTNSNGGINAMPRLFGLLGIGDWPEAVKKAYPGFFAETNGAASQPAVNDLFPGSNDWEDAFMNIWYPDWTYLEIPYPQTLAILEMLTYEAPQHTDTPIPNVEAVTFTLHIAFPSGAEYDVACAGNDVFYLKDFQTQEVYVFNSTALRETIDNAILKSE